MTTHEFAPGSGPLPDSDPEACDVCGEPEDHRNHNVDDPSLTLQRQVTNLRYCLIKAGVAEDLVDKIR